MKSGKWMPLIGAVALAACAPNTPDEIVLLDEQVALTRIASGDIDVASREIEVDSDAIVVATVDEKLIDVHVKLATAGRDAEVENNLAGAGVEIAALTVPGSARVKILLEGPQNTLEPGTVHLRVMRFKADASRHAPLAARVAGYQAYAEGTRSNLRARDFKASGAAALDRAVASLAQPDADPRLAAQAQLVKANGLRFFRIDFHQSRAAAQVAAQSFAALPGGDALGAARARLIEARALIAMTGERATKDPTAEDPAALARGILTPLAAPNSVFGIIERTRAASGLAELELVADMLDDAEQQFNAARTIYRNAGYFAGEREMRCHLARALLERGRFRDAAQAFEALLPDLDLIADPDLRVEMTLGAARGQSFSGRTDRAVELQLKALEVSREYGLRVREAGALQGLGHAYQNRGDLLQARAFFAEALRITREQNDITEYVWGLASAGVVARDDGDYAQAIKLHEEAVEKAFNPIAKVRTLRELGLDYYAQSDYPRAIEQYRKSLAVKLQDPKHHAYSDVKRNLAQTLTDNDDGSGASFKEVARLIDETLESSLKVGDKLGVIGAHRVRANLLAAQGRSTEALKEFETTFALAKEYREKSSSTEARGATLVHEQYALRGYLDVAMKDLVARGGAAPRPASKREEAALYTLERARDTYFGPARFGDLDASTSARVDSILSQMADKSVKIAAMLRTELDARQSAELATLQTDMSNLHAELDSVRTEAAGKRTAANNTSAAPPALRGLAPGVVQISYAVGNRHAYVWARDAKGLRVAALAKSPKDLEQELIALGALDRQADPVAVEQALARVSDDLLPRDLLPADTGALEIVAEGRIAGVPFAGLVPASTPARRLVETRAITMISSMYSVETPPRLTQARPFRLVALASGTSGLRSVRMVNPVAKLQAASSEIRAVADLFAKTDPRANIRLMVAPEGTASQLRNMWVSGADVVHFATHALADLSQPLASLLVLPATDAKGAPTYLTAGQVEAWRGDAGLVFLSACDSAIGPPRYAGGMPGLQRAFLRAGARGVIATLWPIEDVMAKEFSADFYRRYTQGLPAAQALSETQRAWLAPQPGMSEAQQARRRITALAHGFYTQ